MNAANIILDDSQNFTKVAPSLPEGRTAMEMQKPNPEQPGVGNAPFEAPKGNNRRRHILLGAAVLAGGVATAVYYSVWVAPFESTDDAFIEAHITAVAPQVSGRVDRLFVEDNQEVKPGDVLLQIDPSDYQAALDRERANLAATKSRMDQAQAELTVDRAKVGQEQANVLALQADAKLAESDDQRYQAVGSLAASQSRLDLAATQAASARAQVEAARGKELAAEAQLALDRAAIQTAAAEVRKSEAAVHQAELNFSYTRVAAPAAGFVTHRAVEAGAYVQTGQSLLAIVPRQVWIVANFKETQLEHMRPGQPVVVTMDAYPRIKFTGRVDSIQSGTGPRFSLLPPENASGNYVKVVQRVPVKIVLNGLPAADLVLGPGMSVVPTVRIK
jgi:membrane fusion protein (multidrug efflux system)